MLEEFASLPDKLWRKGLRDLATSRKALLILRDAIAIDLLLHCPTRMQNMSDLNFELHLCWPQGRGKPALLRFDGDETKTKVAIAFDVPAELGDRLLAYREEKHLSDAITRLLRRLIGVNHPNRGDDIIYRVHGQIFEQLLKPNSADGKALREAFTARVTFRIKDALVAEHRYSRIPVQVNINTKAKGRTIEEIVQIVPHREPHEPADDSAVEAGSPSLRAPDRGTDHRMDRPVSAVCGRYPVACRHKQGLGRERGLARCRG